MVSDASYPERINPMRRTRHVDVPFRVDPWGVARSIQPVEHPTAAEALRPARLIAASEAGSRAFHRAVDVEAGRYEGDAELLATHGSVDIGQLVR